MDGVSKKDDLPKAVQEDPKDLSSEEVVKQDSLNSKIKAKVYSFIESTAIIIFMMLITVFVLFSDDIRQVGVDRSKDEYFYYTVLVCFTFFFIEIILTFYSKPDYRWGFFFWLDIISTLSLLLDTEWVSDLIFNGSTSNTASQKSATSFAKTARASRIGTRASRIVRIVRLIRLIRVVKLYKATKQAEVKTEVKKKEKIKRAHMAGRKQPPVDKAMAGSGRNLRTPSAVNSVKKSLIDSRSIDRTLIISPFANSRMPMKRNSNVSPGQMGSFIHKKGSPSEAGLNNSRLESHDDAKKNQAVQEAYIPDELEELNDNELYQETNVGKQLSDLTTKRVIILILSIMISIPIFSIDTYWSDYSSYQSGAKNLIFMLSRNKDLAVNRMFLRAWRDYIELHTIGEFPNTLLNITLVRKADDDAAGSVYLTKEAMQLSNTSVGETVVSESYYGSLREYEKKTIIEPDDVDNLDPGAYAILAEFDISKDFNLNSYLNIGRTVFVCIILSASAIFFSKDASELVLDPIENMLKKVKRISENPLKAALTEEEQSVFWNDFNKSSKKKSKEQSADRENYETTILEKTIVKIGALLALGFGEAGAQIVANNMQSGGELDPMIPGKKVVAIFGFCDIRNFTDATEVLQEGVISSYIGHDIRE